jgi:hypothetical protein
MIRCPSVGVFMNGRVAAGIFAATLVLLVTIADAQENSVSLGELARRERERKAAAKPAHVIDLLDLKRDCGGDWSCFLAALGENKPARITFPNTVDDSDADGLVVRSEVVLETDKVTEDSAVLSARTQNTTVFLTDPERARLLLNGYTRQAIDGREQQAEERAKRQDALLVTCVFQKKALKQFIENRKNGEFSDRDWDLAENCDGLDRTATNPFGLPPSP